MNYIFTSEAVTEGHPDKIADRIADSILDEIIKDDPTSRVACEAIDLKNRVIVFGEITTKTHIDYEKVVRDTVKEIGYDKDEYGFNYKTMQVDILLNKQSLDIAHGIEKSENKDLGAGDQGIMFGYATDETDELMPLPISLAQALAMRLTKVRKDGIISYLRPDGKTQVSVEYENDEVKRIDTILISTQHDEDATLEAIKKDIKREVVDYVIPKNLIDDNTKILINPTGRFVIGGPLGDTGLTGRKIIVDTYGGFAHHGGGSFSGKDPTKVDRSAAYMARYAAKNIVAAGLARRLEIQLSYAIGVAKPISIYVNSFGTSILPDDKIRDIINEVFDFRPSAIIKNLDLNKPRYKNVSVYGHFGRKDLDLPWEKLDKVKILKKYII